MKPITPKEGEHPLATKTRSLHRELALAYFMVVLLLVVGTFLYVESDLPGLAKIIATVMMRTAAPITIAFSWVHWRWSK